MEGGFNRSEFNRLLYERYVTIWEEQLTEQQAQDAFWAVNFQYTPWPYIEDEELNRDAFVDVRYVKINLLKYRIYAKRVNYKVKDLATREAMKSSRNTGAIIILAKKSEITKMKNMYIK